VQGEKVREFEKKLCKLNKTKYAIMVNSGTAALHTALVSSGIGAGDEVITTPFSFIATVNTILMCGAKPIFVDIDEEKFMINPDLIEEKITSRTKAILTVDLYGQACDYEKIRKIAKKHKLKIISDSCQAIGVQYKKKPISYWADVVCFSFYATKNITTGEGGALVTDDPRVFEYARRFRQHGQDMEKPYVYHHIGYNYRSTDILASIGLVQLKFLKKWSVKRYKNAKLLISKLKKVKGVRVPNLPEFGAHVFHQFTIRVTEDFSLIRDQLKSYLLESGIRTGVYYPSVLAKVEYIQKITQYKKGMYPVAEKAAVEVLSLPVHPYLREVDVNKIVSAIKKAANEKK